LPALFQEISVPEAVLNEVTDSGKDDFPAVHLAQQPWGANVLELPESRDLVEDLCRSEGE